MTFLIEFFLIIKNYDKFNFKAIEILFVPNVKMVDFSYIGYVILFVTALGLQKGNP